MEVELIDQDGAKATYRLKGEILSSADLEFLDEIEESIQEVLLDLSGITYINSSGFGALVEEAMNFKEAQKKLNISKLDPNIRRTIDILGAEELLDFVD